MSGFMHNATPKLFGYIFQIMYPCFRHEKVILHPKENRIHVHYTFYKVDLIVGIFPTGYRDGIIYAPIHIAILVANDFKFLPADIPVNALSYAWQAKQNPSSLKVILGLMFLPFHI